MVEPEERGFRRWAPLLVVSLATFMFALDMTLMNVAVSAISRDLNTEVGAVQAAIALYPLVMAALILTGAKLGDIRGARWTFILGVGIFGVGTFIAALSPHIGVLLLGWSFLEGIGAALFYPLAFVFVFLHYSGTRRIFGFGVVTALTAIGAALGPVVGGALTTFASWRWGFGMEVFIVAAIIPLASRYLMESEKDTEATLDWVGAFLFAFALLTMVTGVLLGPRFGWWGARRPFFLGDVPFNPVGLSPTPLLIIGGLALLAAFVHWQRRRERRNQTPLLQLRILRHRPYLLATAADALRALFFAGITFLVPLFLLVAVGFTAFQSGLALLPLTAASLVASLTTARLANRVAPKYIVIAGLVLMVIGAFWFLVVTNTSMTLVTVVGPGILFGLGIGLYYTQIINLQLSYVEDAERNQASGFRTMGTQVAASFGTALIGAILLSGFYAHFVDAALMELGVSVSPDERERLIVELEDAVAGLRPEEINEILAGLPPDQRARITELVGQAATTAMQTAWLAVAALIILALLLTTFLPPNRLEDKPMSSFAEPAAESDQAPG